MEWNANNYQSACGRVTEHGAKVADVLRGRIQGGRILDLGCGTGELTHEIAKFSDEAIGIDLSPDMIKKAKESYPSIKFLVMDACALEWESYFDAVFSNAVLHFIKTQDALLDSVCKSLTKNGVFVCEFGSDGNLANLLSAVEQACLKRGMAYSLRFFYPKEDEYVTLLENHGFVVENVTTYDLDTRLNDGEAGLRNWLNMIFSIELGWFNPAEREEALTEIESKLSPTQWDGTNWHLANRRLQVIARKI